MKEYPARNYNRAHKVDLIFTGLTSAESYQRKIFMKWKGPYYQVKEGWFKCHPIYDWSESDVWSYIREKELPYNKLYDLGIDRCGCMPCTAFLLFKENLLKQGPKGRKLLRWILKRQNGQYTFEDYVCKKGGA